ncbi:MAG: metallophosphoesterase [Candidatus Aenigmarchaeota archaeon]|nr:metallophosphoesterase [Candidatus Aenigmarchaeota archaeon]
MDVKFLTGEPALTVGGALVVADLHLGIELEFRKAGMRMPSQTHVLRKRLETLLEKSKTKELVVCGDLKHKVPGTTFQEEKEIPEFLSRFDKVLIARGNHDADLKPLLPPEATMHPSGGFLQGKTFFVHGHAWPSPAFLEADTMVAGHVQPQIEITDQLGYTWREQVWVRASLDREMVEERYGKNKQYGRSKGLPKLIILPSFNPLAGGLALNKKARNSPLLKIANLKKAKLYLLDGTFLGELGKM